VRAQLHHLYHDNVSELTGLPGTQAIEEKIVEVTGNKVEPWAIVYVDIENFEAYNESYSFIEGDDMISMGAHALQQAVEEEGKAGDFIGHAGGDKFVIITLPDRAEKLTEAANRLFVEATRDFYSPTDREQGYLVTIDHQGNLSHRPLCTLGFDVVTGE
jgi:diguanylate cyclase (GGDEF)-like protein